jgi:hypothetical protein
VDGADPSGPAAPSIATALAETLARADPDSFTFADLAAAGGERAIILLLVLMNLPNVVFAPPVLAGIVAVPTAAFGLQLMAGRSEPWLPASLKRQKVAVQALRRMLDTTGPWLSRIEGFGRPRLASVGRLALPLLGLFALLAGVIVLLPLPGTNVLPSLALVLLGIGALRRDGVLVLIGTGIGLLGAVVAALAAGLAVELIRWGLDAL